MCGWVGYLQVARLGNRQELSRLGKVAAIDASSQHLWGDVDVSAVVISTITMKERKNANLVVSGKS